MSINQEFPEQMRFGELFDLYFLRHAETRLKCSANVKYWASAHLARWADLPVNQIRQTEVQQWVDILGQKSPSSANRAVHQLAAIISWGMKRGLISLPGDRNPCKWVEKFRLASRDRFLLVDEMESFLTALQKESETIRCICMLALLTGARRPNICAMRWEEVDFKLRIWRIPGEKFKNGDPHIIPLNDGALSILQERLTIAEVAEYVFPSNGKTGHVVEIKQAWTRIIKRAGITDFRFHDLRRTVGSYLAIGGYSAYIIGRILGHKDPRSTAVYARLDLNPVRHGLNYIDSMLGNSPAAQATMPLEVEAINEPPRNEDPASEGEQSPLLRLYRADMPERQCGRSKNADMQVDPALQPKVEKIILRCLEKGQCRRTDFHHALGGRYNINGRELFRILCEMEDRGLIQSYLARSLYPRGRNRMAYRTIVAVCVE